VNNKAESRRQKAEGSERRVRRSLSSSRFLPTARRLLPSGFRGFSLIELVITVTVLAILTLGVVPVMQVSAKRQKELQLRDSLRQMREAIDQFHREALAGAQLQANQQPGQNPTQPTQPNPTAQPGNIFNDPRVRVAITDQTLFTVDNPDRYPPDLETLVKGVNVLPLAMPQAQQGGIGLTGDKGITDVNQQPIPKTKVYLRKIPIDPMTGKADWDFRSCYDPADSTSWGGENVFDVHSKSDGKALNGEKYSDW
jgi:general secretion pathway protein G